MKVSWINNQPVMVDKDGPFPSKVIVCPSCEGRGTTLIPGMRGHAYTHDQLDELGEDFIDEMMSGVYDTVCNECQGKRITATPIVSDLSEQDLARLEAHYEDLYTLHQMRLEVEAERRMGA